MPGEIPDSTWAPNGRVSAIVQVGDTVIIGGTFTEIRDAGGYGSNALPRSNIAAFDATTGAPLTSWAPSLDGAVRALVASPDGKRVFVGGNFTHVGSTSRVRLAALDVATGALDKTFKPLSLSAEVRALAVAGAKVYVGGFFKQVGGSTGVTRSRLAAFDATTGALDPAWTPSTDSVVRALALSADGAHLFVGGDFGVVSGQPRLNLAELNTSDGTLDAGWHPDPGFPVLALATNDTSVFVAGGGSANALGAYDAGSGTQRWLRHSNGDFQAVVVSGSIVYGGGHFDTFEGQLRRKLVALDAQTGTLRKGWKPIFPTDDTQWGGVWSLSAHAGTLLAVGGDFLTVSGAQQQHYAQFTGDIDGATGDVTPPETPTNVTATPLGGSTVRLDWSASTDDDAVASYDVLRDGVKVASSETSTYTDSSVSPNTTYTYRVVAYDFAGHASDPSGDAAVTTGPPDEVLTFTPTDDTTLDSTLPDRNSGTSTALKADKDPLKEFLLKFNLSGVAGRQVISATLRLNCTNASTNGGQFRAVGNNWSESTVTWNTAPAADPVVTGALDDVLVGRTYDVDLTPLVRGDGPISVRDTATSTDGSEYTSKEGAVPPKLIVRLADPAAKMAPQPLFSDGFETGDMSRWTERSGLALRHYDAFSGAWSVRAHSDGQPQYAHKDLRATETDVWTKLRFKQLATGPDSVVLQKLRIPNGTSLMRLFLTGSGRLGVRNDVSGRSITNATAVTPGTWHTVEAHVVVADTASRIDVYQDGRQLDALTITDGLGTTPITRVQLGDESSGKTFDVALDGFALDRQRRADTTAPTAPTGLTADAPFPYSGKVSLSWQAAQDDFDVAQYRIYRDGALIDTIGNATTYADTTVAPETAYTYTVQAVDAAGNASPVSAPASIVTPATDTSPPTVPAGVTATAVSFDRVDVAWSPSSDDAGVAGYRIFRDGTLLDTVDGSATSYRDVSVSPATTYSYTVVAVDGSDNASAPSDGASASTPEATVFMDGFESGDLSQWTTVSGMVVESADTYAYAGAWAARAAATGGAAFVSKTLGTAQPELVVSMRLKIVNGGGTTVSVLKLRRADGTSLLRLFTGGTGKLSLRNDVTGASTTSSTVVSAGVWHAVQVHVAIGDPSSQVEVFLDGTKVAVLSQAQAIGTAPIGRLQVGDDATGKTYTMLYDDVVADAPPATTAAPTVFGTTRDGETLSADPGTWSGTRPMAFAYRWRRCDDQGGSCADIDGATGDSYVLTADDVGHTLRVGVTASNSVGSATAASDATAVVGN